MTPDEHELLADLQRVCDQAPLFVLEFTAGGLSVDAEEAYASRLVDVAEGLMRHARSRELVAAGACSKRQRQADPMTLPR